MNKTDFMRGALIALPLIAATLGSGVYAFELKREARLTGELKRLESAQTSLEIAMKGFPAAEDNSREATVPLTKQEQPEFLSFLRARAQARSVRILHWSDTTPVETPAAATPDPSNLPLPAGIAALKSRLETEGSYNNTRLFLYDVQGANRLLALNEIKCTHGEHGGVQLAMAVTRYVTPAPEGAK